LSTQDTRTARIGRAIELSGRGEGDQARQLLTELWDELEDGNDVVQRCAVAHHLADVQDDPRDELKWDLRALQAADDLPPRRSFERARPRRSPGYTRPCTSTSARTTARSATSQPPDATYNSVSRPAQPSETTATAR